MDPDCLLPGTLAPDPGLGDVRVCVLLRGHHFPDGHVHNWYSWRGGFLDHTGECWPREFVNGVGDSGRTT